MGIMGPNGHFLGTSKTQLACLSGNLSNAIVYCPCPIRPLEFNLQFGLKPSKKGLILYL